MSNFNIDDRVIFTENAVLNGSKGLIVENRSFGYWGVEILNGPLNGEVLSIYGKHMELDKWYYREMRLKRLLGG